MAAPVHRVWGPCQSLLSLLFSVLLLDDLAAECMLCVLDAVNRLRGSPPKCIFEKQNEDDGQAVQHDKG